MNNVRRNIHRIEHVSTPNSSFDRSHRRNGVRDETSRMRIVERMQKKK